MLPVSPICVLGWSGAMVVVGGRVVVVVGGSVVVVGPAVVAFIVVAATVVVEGTVVVVGAGVVVAESPMSMNWNKIIKNTQTIFNKDMLRPISFLAAMM